MSALKRPIVFSDKEIDRVLDEMSTNLKDDVSRKVINPISSALDLLKEVYAHFLLLPETPTATVRIETLQTILRNFEAELPEARYPVVLCNAGREIGRSFAKDFIQTLQKIERIPMDMKALLSFWLEIESRARWGVFHIKKDSRHELVIEVTDFFLTRGLSDNIHRNCSFMEGYIESFLWETTKNCSRWFLDQYHASVTERFPEPTSVKDEAFGPNCRFRITLKEEELTGAFNEFYQARKFYSIGDYRAVSLSIRTALELAFKSKIGIEASKQAPIIAIIKAFKDFDMLSSLSYRMIKDLYGRSSAIIHGSLLATEEYSNVLIRDTGEVLRILELTSLKEEKKEKLRNSINV